MFLSDVTWSVINIVPLYNSRFNALDTLTVVVHYVKMPVDFGGILLSVWVEDSRAWFN